MAVAASGPGKASSNSLELPGDEAEDSTEASFILIWAWVATGPNAQMSIQYPQPEGIHHLPAILMFVWTLSTQIWWSILVYHLRNIFYSKFMGIPGYGHSSDKPILMGPGCGNRTPLGVCLKMGIFNFRSMMILINQQLWGYPIFRETHYGRAVQLCSAEGGKWRLRVHGIREWGEWCCASCLARLGFSPLLWFRFLIF
jgi:hypothetical protein